MFEPNILAAALGTTLGRAVIFAPWIQWSCEQYEIDTPARFAIFCAQVGHESGGLKWTSELWGPTAQQRRYERDVKAPWPASAEQAKTPAYAVNRLAYGLGNARVGDGSLFRGHGLIQTTGRSNHAVLRDRLRSRFTDMDVPDFEATPLRLCEPQWASLSAADYWDMRGLNAFCDAQDFERVTRRINGGTNGMADRLARWETAKNILS